MYANLIAVMAQKNVSVERLAKAIHKHRNTASNKLYGDGEFTYDEAMVISDELFPEYRPSYLFYRVPSNTVIQ